MGSPVFLTPEVVWGHMPDLAMCRMLFDATDTYKRLGGPQPPITAAINEWALGVTLFGPIVGDTLFLPIRTVQSRIEAFYQTTPWVTGDLPSPA